MKPLKFLIGLTAALLLVSCDQKKDVPNAEIMTIAKEAYIYGYPMVKNYRLMYAAAVDTKNPNYRKPFNEFYMAARVDTPTDKNRETATNDTPCGSAWLDLRREPLVLTVPAVDEGRYYSVQFSDLYSHNFDYAGTRTSGNKGGKFLIVGPGWKGEKPTGIDRIIQSETQLAHALVRIQLLNPEDMPNVQKIQSQFTLSPLSTFAGTNPPADVAPLKFPAYSDEKDATPAFYAVLNFMMQFGTPPQEEAEMMKRFAKISVGVGKVFSAESLPEGDRKAYQSAIDGAIADLNAAEKGGTVKSTDLHGTRTEMKNNYPNRAYGARTDIRGASPREILSIAYKRDSESKVLNGANDYTIRFEKGKLPPANAFWSLTMYELPGQLLVDNPAKRYYINSTMLSKMVTDPADGSVTIFIEKNPAAGAAAKAADAAPKAADAAPKAADAAPKAAGAAPKVAGVAPKVADAAPKVAGVAPKVAGVAPKAADAAPKAADAAPKAADAAPKAADATPKAAVAAKSVSLAANALPAPAGEFYVVMRIYLPKDEVLNGTWKEPVVMRLGGEASSGAAAKPAEGQKPDAAKPVAATPSAAATPAAPAKPVSATAVPVTPAAPAAATPVAPVKPGAAAPTTPAKPVVPGATTTPAVPAPARPVAPASPAKP